MHLKVTNTEITNFFQVFVKCNSKRIAIMTHIISQQVHHWKGHWHLIIEREPQFPGHAQYL